MLKTGLFMSGLVMAQQICAADPHAAIAADSPTVMIIPHHSMPARICDYMDVERERGRRSARNRMSVDRRQRAAFKALSEEAPDLMARCLMHWIVARDARGLPTQAELDGLEQVMDRTLYELLLRLVQQERACVENGAQPWLSEGFKWLDHELPAPMAPDVLETRIFDDGSAVALMNSPQIRVDLRLDDTRWTISELVYPSGIRLSEVLDMLSRLPCTTDSWRKPPTNQTPLIGTQP